VTTEALANEPQVVVRPYRPPDREALLTIAADSAFFGEPVEAFLEDRRLYGYAMFGYYLDVEPQHAWVADVRRHGSSDVVGFLVGSVDTRRKHRLWLLRVLPVVIARALGGQYRLGRATWRFAWAELRTVLSGGSPRVPLNTYQAHLHMSVASSWRSMGVGTALLHAFLNQLRQLAVPGVHLQTTTRNKAAVALYERMGFRRLDARRSREWAHLVDEPIWNLAYGLRLR